MRVIGMCIILLLGGLCQAETYHLKETLDALPSGATLKGAALGPGRLTGQQGLLVSNGEARWALEPVKGAWFVEVWVRPQAWDAQTPEEVPVLSARVGAREVTLRKAKGAARLELVDGGLVAATYPIHDWVDQPWMNVKGYRKDPAMVKAGTDMWHFVYLRCDGERLTLIVDGFAAGGGTAAGDLSGVALLGGPGSVYSWLHVGSGEALALPAIRARYRSLFRGLPDLRRNAFTVPWLSAPPAIDGNLDDAAWGDAAAVTGFVCLRGADKGHLVTEPIRLMAGYDARYLYLSLRTPFSGELRAKDNGYRDAPLYGEESYEMFLHPPFTGVPEFCQLIGNPYGNQADLKMLNADWNGRWDWRASISDGAWSGELRADFAGIDTPLPGPAAVWSGNFVSTYANAGWCWTQRYNDSGSFGTIRFAANAPVIRVGDYAVAPSIRLPLALIGRDHARQLSVALQWYAPEDVLPSETDARTVELAPDKRQELELALPFAGDREGTLVAFVREGDTDLYYQAVKLPLAPPAVRTGWPTTEAAPAPKQTAEAGEPTPAEVAESATWSAEEIGQFLLDVPSWQGNSLGLSEDVPAPWTPLEVDGQTIRCWGREYRYADSLLPAQITSLGEPLLSGRPRFELQAGDRAMVFDKASFEVVSTSPREVVVRTVAEQAPFRLSLRTTYAFDGMAKLELTVSCPDDISTMDGLRLVLPLVGKHSGMYHVVSSASGHAPNSTSDVVPADGLRLDQFREVIWCGSTTRGMSWFAEGMMHWPLRDEQDILTVLPDGEGRRLTVKLGDAPLRLEQPLALVFGLQATPMKPQPANPLAVSDYTKLAWNWFWGIGDYCPWQDDHIAAARDQIANARARGQEVMPCSSLRFYGQYRMHLTAFGANSHPGLMNLECMLFGKDWMATTLPLQPWEMPARHTAPGNWYGKKWKPTGLQSMCPASDFQDFYIARLAELIKTTDLGAIYLDQPLTPCSNARHGCGYIDYQGKLRPSAPIFAVRRHLMRIYQLFQQAHGKTLIKWHSSNQIVPPIMSFVDVFWDGENYGSGPQKVFEFYSADLSGARLRTQHTGSAFGFACDLLPEFEARYAPTPDSARDLMGVMLLHGSTVYPSHMRYPAIARFVQERYLGLLDESMRTTAYWEEQPGLALANDGVKARLSVGERRAVLLAFNWTDQPITTALKFDGAAAGMAAAPTRVTDVLTGETWAFSPEQQLAIEPRNLRILHLTVD